ncbi:hypothetical protein [uncultured Draconibacterium sp.]|uniref:hypothetical protein n=1 Tax=uncultured Draconibacterium sp. TaxID=1573823 RepID=UPI0032619C91
MAALVILLVLILISIGLLFSLIRRFLQLRQSLKIPKQEFQNRINMRSGLEKTKEQMELKSQLHSLIDYRLHELEQKFPNTLSKTDASTPKTETLTKNFKMLMQTTLKLLKS